MKLTYDNLKKLDHNDWSATSSSKLRFCIAQTVYAQLSEIMDYNILYKSEKYFYRIVQDAIDEFLGNTINNTHSILNFKFK